MQLTNLIQPVLFSEDATNEHYKEFMKKKIEAPCQYLPKAQADSQAKKKEDVVMKNENVDKLKVSTQLSNLQIAESSNSVNIVVKDLF